ncbi:MAG TPA: replication-relaxation family protein [Candidatus Saccharimonadales bacterium]|nr:replication-relaxation family protein [Candidatus Saccharimonadales bacterium]
MAISRAEPKYRRPLNQEQVDILELIYKFRFVTIATVKDYFAETNPGMNVFKRLETLETQGFIAKRYFDNFRLLHKPVVYYLLPDGVRKLNEYRDEDDRAELKGIYRDGVVSERFAMHCVAIFDLYNRLSGQYGDELEFLAKSDQTDFEDFPKQKPDAYLTLGVRHYFVDVLDDDAHLLIDASKKVKRYIEYRKSGDWAVVNAPFPQIILVCNTEDACNRVQKRSEYLLSKAWVTDIALKVATSVDVTLS